MEFVLDSISKDGEKQAVYVKAIQGMEIVATACISYDGDDVKFKESVIKKFTPLIERLDAKATTETRIKNVLATIDADKITAEVKI